MRRLLLGAGLLLASLVAWADVPPIPALTARVTDLTATLSGDQRQHLEQQLAALEAKSGAQLAVLLVPTTGDDSIEEYAVRTFEKWKLGQKKVDDGVLLLVAKNDRTLRIEVGYGLEGAITDVQAGRIISEQITPQFRQGNFYGGIQAGVDSLVQLIDAEKNPDSATASAPVDALPAVPEATPPRALPAPVDEGEVYDSAPPEPKKKSGLSGQLWGNPVYLGVYVAVLLAVALLGRLLPLQWMRRRSIGRFLLCSAAVARLSEEKRAWLLEDGAELVANLCRESDPREAYREVKLGWRLRPQQLAVLRELCAWREEQARLRNRPRNHVLRERTLWPLARLLPKNKTDLAAIEDMHPRTVRQDGDFLIELIAQAARLPQSEWPEALPEPLPPEVTPLLKSLRAIGQREAETLGMAPELMLRKKILEALLKSGYPDGPYELPDSLRGWRRERMGQALLDALESA